MIYIYLETENPSDGKETNEVNFIKILVERFTGKKYEKDFKIIGFGGYNNFEPQANLLKSHEDPVVKNLLIFDADTKSTGGGFVDRKKYLLKIKARLNLEFELFLYPNNKDDGIFENLLEMIVNEKHRHVIDYFKEYEQKLSKYNDVDGKCPYEVPDQKARMYAYISAFKRSRRQKELFKNKKDWDFLNEEYWNLDSKKLKPLKDFICNFS